MILIAKMGFYFVWRGTDVLYNYIDGDDIM